MSKLSVVEARKTVPVDIWIRNYNQQRHLHLHDCSCRISKAYEFYKSFPNYLESVKFWEINNELGTIIRSCYPY